MLHDLMQHPGMVRTIEYRFRRLDGGWHWIESCFSNLLDVPGIEAVVINFRKIDERKRAEESLAEANRELTVLLHRAEDLAFKAEAATRAKSEFLTVMSHELRTPLNAVLGFSEMLAETALTEEQRSFTDTVLKSGNHLLDMVNDILDFSSIEKGGIAVESSRVALADLVESVCLKVRKSAEDRGLEFRCEIAPGVPEQITGDGRRIRKILGNLLGNAVKFTSTGAVVLRVAESSDSGRRVLDFSIEDTGPGIPAATLEDLFQPFTQADSTINRAFGGAGLGLAISRRLAEAMGGKLTVASTPGQGSTFTLRVPLDSNPPSTGSSSSAGAPPL
jgi:signal transduction histidine kinase